MPSLIRRLSLALELIAVALAVWLTVGQKQAAQSTYGTIAGIVTDASGAVISSAKVEVLNQGTRAGRSIITDAEGNYRFLNLDPGSYSITVSAQNFTTKKK